MKIKKLLLLVMLFSFFSFEMISAQKRENDSLLTLSIVEEPVTLHKNRIQINTGYQYDMFWIYYNDLGQRINIVDHGQVGSLNQLNYYIRYGLTDYLQLGLQQGYNSGYESYGTIIKTYFEETINYTSVKQFTGFSDVLLNVGYRMTTKNKVFELGLFPGIYFPMSHNPKEPTYNVGIFGEDEDKWINLDQTTNEKTGSGGFRFEIAGKTKLRLNKKMAIQLSGKYNFPLATVKAIQWNTIYDGNEYSSIKEYYEYSPKQEMLGNIEFQIVPDKKEIIGLTLGANLISSLNEWSKINDSKVEISNSSLCRLYAGIELIVTDRIRFNQQFWYDITGKNINGTIGLQSSFTFNFLRNEK